MSEYYTNFAMSKDWLLLRGVKNGVPFQKRMKPHIPVYVLANDQKVATGEVNLQGEPLSHIDFSTVAEAKEFIDLYQGMEGYRLFYNHRMPYGVINRMYDGKIDYKVSDISVAWIDLECECENGFPKPQLAQEAINAITLHVDGIYHVFGTQVVDISLFANKDEVIEYHLCDSEYDLLTKFVEVWKRKYPNVVTGWNIENFDVPYLVNRITKVLGIEKVRELSPWNNVYSKRAYDAFGHETQKWELVGVSVLDYLKVYQKFTAAEGKKESYRLGFIAEHEKVAGKMDISEYGGIATIYKVNYQKFIEYNMRDVRSVRAIDSKRKLMDSAISLAYNAKINFADILSQVHMWECIIMNDMWTRKEVPEQSKKRRGEGGIPGAYVMEPEPGLEEWVVTIDLDAMYPNLIMMLNISPETLIADSISEMIDIDRFVATRQRIWEHREDEIFALNQARFMKHKRGMFRDLVERMYADRIKYKKLLLEAKKELEAAKKAGKSDDENKVIEDRISHCNVTQAYLKICLNSLYGVLAQPSFMFFDVRAAAAVTVTGQGAIKWISARLNEYFNKLLGTDGYNYVKYMDTDSVTLRLSPLVHKFFTQKECQDKQQEITTFLGKTYNERVNKFVEKAYIEFTQLINANENKLVFKLDTISSKAIYLTKKQYVYNVLEAEGVRYAHPKRKVMGGKSVKSSTPKICREKMTGLIDIVMEGDQSKARKFIEDFRTEHRKLPIEEIATPSGINDLSKYRDAAMLYVKATPFHVKGALIHNKALEDCGIRDMRPIDNGDKIMTTYLKVPNPLKRECISFRDFMHPLIKSKYGLDKYVDYPAQFEKTFENFAEELLKAAGMTLKESVTLDAFFE